MFHCFLQNIIKSVQLFVVTKMFIKIWNENLVLSPYITHDVTNIFMNIFVGKTRITLSWLWWLKEYYEIVNEARPLSGFFFPTHADIFFYRNAFIIMKRSKPPSFRVIRALIAVNSVFLTFLMFFFCISLYTSSVVFWHVTFWEYVC